MVKQMITTYKNDADFIVKNYFNDFVGYCRDVLKYDPDTWQVEAGNILSNESRLAVASGHGIGKTRFDASAIHWFLATRPHPQIVVTANTETQLSTKTWRELVKINQQALNKDWFDHIATRFYLKSSPDTWFAAAIAWNEKKPEAFAGTHEKYVLYIFDEASAIPDIIWDTSEGAMTSENAKWVVMGNPTRNTGRFVECFGRFRHRWHCMQVDSRTSKIADQKQIQQWVDDYGEDSDFVRVRVRGIFPRAGSCQFIDRESVDACLEYAAIEYEWAAKIFGIDIARFGEDQNVVAIRQARKVLDLNKWRGIDTMQTSGKIVELYQKYNPDMLFVDGGGVGGGVVDRLRQLLPKDKVQEVNFGSTAHNPNKYMNRRAEIWGLMKDAIIEKLDIPIDQELIADLTAVEYGFDSKQRIQLEKKEDMKKRGQASPDCGDALALTFAEPVIREKPQSTYHPHIKRSWRG
jgi:hypothetical protein